MNRRNRFPQADKLLVAPKTADECLDAATEMMALNSYDSAAVFVEMAKVRAYQERTATEQRRGAMQ